MKKNQWMQRRKSGAMIFGVAILLLVVLSLLLTDHAGAAVTPPTPHAVKTRWTPTGVTWTLAVTFLSGSRKGQSEVSLMTFLPNGQLTATFPQTSLLPAIDGHWQMTAPHAFHYRFREPLMQNGEMVAYVQVQVDAIATSQTTYEAGGVGVTYAAATGQPIAGQDGVTYTAASAS